MDKLVSTGLPSRVPDPILVPTPIQEIACPETDGRGIRLFVKRDDLLPFSFGGNKVRIALEFVKDACKRGANALVMYGDVRSNLCRVLAMLCRELRMSCLMIATTAADHDERRSFNEEIIRSWGIEILSCSKEKIAEAVDAAMERLSSRGLSPYYIYGDRTGTGNEGVAARAYAKAYREICSWEHAHGTAFDLVMVPYGTGSTQGGLICGSLEACDGRRIVGISISSRPPKRAHHALEACVKGWFELEHKVLPVDYADHIHLELGYTCGGYGVRDERVCALIERMLCDVSLPLDPTYTGKALRGALDYLEAHDVHDKNVLFLHTGGLPLFFDYLAQRGASKGGPGA